ncbi:MAG: hypothetical protein MRY83_14090 [Flavobacteriales bacterium]|nr:hypothetical protein [Flavobacteriales bacterium]
MKTLVFSILLSISPILMLSAQTDIGFTITFGSYLNDHAQRKFTSQERQWSLEKDRLIYLIDAHEKRYTDTLMLIEEDIGRILNFITENKLNQKIDKDLTRDYLKKIDSKVSIRSIIRIKKKNYTSKIISNSSSILDEDPDAIRFMDLEKLLYELTDLRK